MPLMFENDVARLAWSIASADIRNDDATSPKTTPNRQLLWMERYFENLLCSDRKMGVKHDKTIVLKIMGAKVRIIRTLFRMESKPIHFLEETNLIYQVSRRSRCFLKYLALFDRGNRRSFKENSCTDFSLHRKIHVNCSDSLAFILHISSQNRSFSKEKE